jgi:hypothetical protein
MSYIFKIIKEEENPLESLIEMSGVTSEFTLQAVLDHKAYVEKVIRENTAQLTVEAQQNAMVEEIFPMAKEIPEDKYVLLASYLGRKIQEPATRQLLETSEKTLASYEERIEQIKEALNISVPNAEETE